MFKIQSLKFKLHHMAGVDLNFFKVLKVLNLAPAPALKT